MAFFIFEYGKITDSLPARLPFFIIIIMFEIESILFKLRIIDYELRIYTYYHEDFLTPGSIPSFANSRKQIRQIPKSRIKAFPRPQRKHRFFCRVENLGFFNALAFTDVFAINKLIGITLLISHFFSSNPSLPPQRRGELGI
jgi:hypothetical protein